jgi:hypothetical protein
MGETDRVGYVTRGPEEDDSQDAAERGDPAEPRRKARPLPTPADRSPLAPPPVGPMVDPVLTPSADPLPPPSLTKPEPEPEPETEPETAPGPADGERVHEITRGELTDESDGDDDEIVDAVIEEVAEGELEYELDEWAVESRDMLAQLLTGAGIAHVWQGGTLVVRAADEAAVDEHVDHVETTTLPTLDPAAEKISYEIDDLDDFQQDHLFDLLEGQEIPFEIDVAGELVILAVDEESVDVIMEAIDFPSALEVDGEGDELDAAGLPVATDVISDLFVAVDRLQHKATDSKGVLGLVEASEHLPRLRVPYGFDTVLWSRIKTDAAALREMLEDDESFDEDIEAAARGLRVVLQDVV